MAPDASNSITANRSLLRDFLTSLPTLTGDLSNITAPPFVLDTHSTVQLPLFWADRLSSFLGPASAEFRDDGGKRMLAVLKWWVGSLLGQQFAGRASEEGVKKPLNAVLGEVGVGWWEGEKGKTWLVSEQVSHHPPVTACRVWNEEAGVVAEGYTRQEISFGGGAVSVKQFGGAVFSIRGRGEGEGGSRGEEVYLIPVPDVKVKGVLTGTPYPELGGRYEIPCSSGWRGVVEFKGKPFLGLGGGERHGFEGRVFKEGEGEEAAMYVLEGTWDKGFEVKDGSGKVVETVDIEGAERKELQTVPLEEQDPYETGRVWKEVREALNRGDMQGVSDAKGVVEQGQRDMRKVEEQEGKTWERMFFKDVGKDEVAEGLRAKIGYKLDKEETVGVWKFDDQAWREAKRPYRGGLRPDNKTDGHQTSDAGQTNGAVAGAAARNDGAEVNGAQSNAQDSARQSSMQSTEKVYPPIPEQEQQKEIGETKLSEGVAGMDLKQQTAVEEFLRDKHSSVSQR